MRSGTFMSTVSIVIPCYNAGRYLTEAVESALAQTHMDVEIVIVDDGSTDADTIELLKTATWPRTRVFTQSNAGPSAARNKGIAEATGEFILPLDADDKIVPTYVEKALAVMASRPDVGIVYCKAQKFGAESGPWQLPPYTPEELVIDNVIFITSLFRKSDWVRAGGFNEKLRHGVEDYDFWVKLLSMDLAVVQLDEFLFHYRVQDVSRTTSFNKQREVVIATYADIFRSNIDFYAKNAETIFRHRFGLYDELTMWRAKYGRVDAIFQKHPWLKRIARFVWRLIR